MARNLSLAVALSDDPDVKRDIVIKFLVTQTEKDALDAAAKAEDVTPSELIRRRVFKTTTTVAIAPEAEPTPRKKGGR